MLLLALLAVLAPLLVSCNPLQGTPSDVSQLTLAVNHSRALEDYQLPLGVRPLSYDVRLKAYLTEPANRAFSFDGDVDISVEFEEATRVIVMHAYQLTISSVTVKTATGVNIGIFRTTLSDDDKHFYTITLNGLAPAGNYSINIIYRGIINEDLDGFYRSNYRDAEGEQRWLGVTQFQPTGARRVFPCWDEPTWKAVFTLSITHAPKYKVISNTPIGEENLVNDVPGVTGWIRTSFLTTLKMSTYLLAFSINEFGMVLNDRYNRFSVWARPEAVTKQATVANEIAPLIDIYMGWYTQSTNPLAKVDQIAIPDFSAGAMENWGLITYRETRLLYEEGVSTSTDLQRVEMVVTHELAHQWFGNLVTIGWWDQIWLNEGFATYFEYHALATVEKSWQLERQFILSEMHVVMQSDALESTHPMLVPNIDSPYSTNAVFNDIAYNKGGSIIRMIVQLIGETRFRLGIKDYIAAKQFGNVVMNDLWTAIATHIPNGVLPNRVNFRTIMESWTLQSGYPVINVTRDYAIKDATVTQNRFLTLPDPAIEHHEIYIVPLTWTSEANPDFSSRKLQWHTGIPAETNLPSDIRPEENQWLILNLQEIGYYRVNYDVRNWELLTEALNDPSRLKHIDVINRAQLMDDALALARANYLNYETALNVTSYLKYDLEYMPWYAALTAMSYLGDRLNNETESKQVFQWYVLSLLKNIYAAVNGFYVSEDDSHMTRLKRALVLKWACELEYELCINRAGQLFNDWKSVDEPSKNNPISPDLKSVVYCVAVRDGDQQTLDFLYELYRNSSNVASEQALILAALGCSSDTDFLRSYLDESIAEDSRIRPQDARAVITAVYSNPLGVDVALDFLLQNWEKTAALYEGVGSTGRVITGLANKLNTQEQRDKLQGFVTNNSTLLGNAVSSFQDAIKVVDVTLTWHQNHRETVVTFLSELQQASPTTTNRPPTTEGDNSASFIALSPFLILTTALLPKLTMSL